MECKMNYIGLQYKGIVHFTLLHNQQVRMVMNYRLH